MRCNKCWSYTWSFSSKFPSWHHPQCLCGTAMQSHLQRCWDPLIRQQGAVSTWLDVKGLNLMSGFYFFLVLCMRSQWTLWLTRTGADRCCHAPQQKPSCSEKIHLKPNEQLNLNRLMNHRELRWQRLSLAPCQWSVLTRDKQALLWQKCAEANQKTQSERNHSPLSCRQMDLKVQVSSYLICFSKVHRALVWKERVI